MVHAERESAATATRGTTLRQRGFKSRSVYAGFAFLIGVSACGDADSDADSDGGAGSQPTGTAPQDEETTATAPQGEGEEGPVKVGSILDATGPLSLYGDPMVKATRLAVDTINANGGVLGRQLELVAVDSQSDIAQYTAGARTLAEDSDIVVVHGGITSASREAIRPIFNEAEMLYFYNQLYEGGVCEK